MNSTKVWKEAQTGAEILFEQQGCFVHRLKDSASAGQHTSGYNPGDYICAKNSMAVFVECKSTITDRFSRSHIDQDQIAVQFDAAKKGVYGAYYLVTHSSRQPIWHIISWFKIIQWYQDPAARVPHLLDYVSKFSSITLIRRNFSWLALIHILQYDLEAFNGWLEIKPKLRTTLPKKKQGLIYENSH